MDRERQLVIDPDYLEFEDRDQIDLPVSRFEKENITGIRYGIKGIKGYFFYIGRVYRIDIRDESGKIIKIRLKSLYGIRKKLLTEKYGSIVQALYENYYKDLVRHYLNLFSNGLPFEVLGIVFESQGIRLRDKDEFLPWNDVGTRDYIGYYALFSKINSNYYRAFHYLEDWNTGILYAVSRSILLDKNLWKQ